MWGSLGNLGNEISLKRPLAFYKYRMILNQIVEDQPDQWMLSLGPWCIEKEQSSVFKTRNKFGRAGTGLQLGPSGSCGFWSWDPLPFLQYGAIVTSCEASVCLQGNVLEIPCVPLCNTVWLTFCWLDSIVWWLQLTLPHSSHGNSA